MRPFGEPETTLGPLSAEAAGTLLSAAAEITLVVDEQDVIRDVATSIEEVTHEAYAMWVGRAWIDCVTVESRPKVESLLRDAEAGRQPPRWRHVNQVLPGNRELPLLAAAMRIERGQGGKRGGRAVVFGRDLRATAALQQRLVDAQQAMERDYWRFRHAETRYRHLFQVASEAVLVVDATTQKILEANAASARLLGDGGVGSLVGQSFPVGVDERGVEALNSLMAGVRATGRPDEARVELLDAKGEVRVAVSTYRQDQASHFLVRIGRAPQEGSAGQAPSTSAMLLRLVQSAPDCLVVTDLDGRVLSANAAFVELAQLTTEDQVRGETLDRWLGRTGVDLSVLISNLRQRGAVRLFATTLRGEYGAVTDVEISATMVSQGEQPFLGFTIRDVGRRLVGEPRSHRELPRSVGQLTELVGRVPLKDIVGETTDLIEQLCIEAALELTRDNRASAAEMLGLSRQSLYVKLRRYGLGNLGDDGEK
ncbi:MAG: transcriptional regulator PpsR [Rubrivivax sp.]|jgi:transcriptional regulator PpsR|nr:transcriptional regulator PpsR [Rubrivivax sp.]